VTASVGIWQTKPYRTTNCRGSALFPDEPKTLAELFVQAASKHDRPDALTYKRDGVWQHISSENMIERIRQLALGLYSLGLRKGDRIMTIDGGELTPTLKLRRRIVDQKYKSVIDKMYDDAEKERSSD
jgi:long-subunit acyl-CoA synthetase (AMP-forming)